MATKSKLEFPSVKDSPSNPTSLNNYQMDDLPASPPEKVSKTCLTSSNSMPLTITPLKTSYSLCPTGWIAPYEETLTSSRLSPPKWKGWMTGGSLMKYIAIETLTLTSMRSIRRWKSWKPPSLYSRGNKFTVTTTLTKHTSLITFLTLRCSHATQRESLSNMVGVLPHSLAMLPGLTKHVGTLSRGGVMSPASRTTWSKQGNRPSVRSVPTLCLCRGYPASYLHHVL
jgi:hypothetical protein